MPPSPLEIMRATLTRSHFSYITHNDRERIVSELLDSIISGLNPFPLQPNEISAIDDLEKELLALRVIVQHMADLAGGGSELGIDDALQFLSDALDLGFNVNQGMVATTDAIGNTPDHIHRFVPDGQPLLEVVEGSVIQCQSCLDWFSFVGSEFIPATPPTTDCKSCNGSGIEPGSIDSDSGNDDGDKCDTCGGSGRVTPATAPTPDPATPAPSDPIAPPADLTTHSPAQAAVDPSLRSSREWAE